MPDAAASDKDATASDKERLKLRVLQWNLLATGLHDDGFVQQNMFPSDKDPEMPDEKAMLDFLTLTKDYVGTLEKHVIPTETEDDGGNNLANITPEKHFADWDGMKGLQRLINYWLFSDALS